MTIDEMYMKEAISLAKMAEEIDEVPVGALIVRGGEVIATAYNTRETSKCATHHAELIAIERACIIVADLHDPITLTEHCLAVFPFLFVWSGGIQGLL